jgi:hypothetical protein
MIDACGRLEGERLRGDAAESSEWAYIAPTPDCCAVSITNGFASMMKNTRVKAIRGRTFGSPGRLPVVLLPQRVECTQRFVWTCSCASHMRKRLDVTVDGGDLAKCFDNGDALLSEFKWKVTPNEQHRSRSSSSDQRRIDWSM